MRSPAPQGLLAAGGEVKDATFKTVVSGVKLNELYSMLLTLHGGQVGVKTTYDVKNNSADRVVTLRDLRFTWIDRADLHPGTKTALSNGTYIDDNEFSAAGWDYDIRIHFRPNETSVWRVQGTTTTHEAGWPSIDGAKAGEKERR